jgi:2-keto-4-pentenoate hydratase/2-oxohepta-3-ene-1,7-dioic acid hydratase in catechol pathway
MDENPAAVWPEEPLFLARLPNSVIHPGEAIVLPNSSAPVDYEVEVGLLVGRAIHRGDSSGALERSSAIPC